jgi:uroporphyrinogen III methyltransferase/synthase
MKTRKVYLIGAGPGKPDLITVRGANILKEADTVIYDYLVDRGILEYTKNTAELICRNGKNTDNILVEKARQGKRVIRLKSGDPAIFAKTSQELATLLKNKINFEVVPGITSGSAGPSLNGIPLTDRKSASSCVFVTGHESEGKKKGAIDWDALSTCGTIVIYMGVAKLGNIVKKLLKAGKKGNTPAAVIQNASLITEKVLTSPLKYIARKAKIHKVKPPAVVVIGEVAKPGKGFRGLRKNKKVLFTGLSKERYFENKFYFHLPLIKIEPMKSYKKFDDHLRNIRRFDWIVFASRYAVEYFFKRLKVARLDSRVLGNGKIAAVGNSTKNRLLDFGVLADLVPEKESSGGLVEAFKKIDLRGKKIFLPRSDISDKGLSEAFSKSGALVTTAFAYRNVMPRNLPELDLNFFDEIMFTSPSTVRNFKKRYKYVPRNTKVSCIGDVTSGEAKRWHLLD